MRWRRLRILAILLATAPCGPAFAQAVRVGDQFQVNSYTPDRQRFNAVDVAPDGSFVVVWAGYGSATGDDSSYSVHSQRYTADGSPVGAELQVNEDTAGAQLFPEVAIQPGGDAVVVWQGVDTVPGVDGSGIRLRRIDPSGAAIGSEVAVNLYSTGRQGFPRLALLEDGAFVVVWDGVSAIGPESAEVAARRFSSAGVPLGEDVQVNVETTDDQDTAAVDADAQGAFVVVWRTGRYYPYPAGFSLRARRFSSTGDALGAELVITDGPEYETNARVGVEADGDFVVVWQEGSYPSGNFDVMMRRFASTGDALGSTFQVNAHTVGFQYLPDLAFADEGRFAVVWADQSATATDPGYSIRQRSFASDGSPIGVAGQINTYTTDDQKLPSIAGDGAGAFVVVWTSKGSVGDDTATYSIQAQRIRLDLFSDGFELGTLAAWSDARPAV